MIQNDEAFVVRGIGLLNDINEIKNVIIENNNGVPLLVKDVATVEISNVPRLGWVGRSDGFIDSTGKRVVTDQEDVVEAIVVMRKGENPTEVVSNLKKEIDKLNNGILPQDTKIVPYYDRSDLIGYATHTVLHNLIEGILLVTFLVSMFMFNWRTTLIVSIIIPMSLLFAFICLHLMGMSANLLSLGAVDFGIIIDGAVVMVEGMFVILDHKAQRNWDGTVQQNNQVGAYQKKRRPVGQGNFLCQTDYYNRPASYFLFSESRGENVFTPCLYPWVCFVGGAHYNAYAGAGFDKYIVEEKRT